MIRDQGFQLMSRIMCTMRPTFLSSPHSLPRLRGGIYLFPGLIVNSEQYNSIRSLPQGANLGVSFVPR